MIDNDNISREAAIAAIKSVPSGNWSSKRYILDWLQQEENENA